MSPPTPKPDDCTPIISKITSAIIGGESFADALAASPGVVSADVCGARPGRRDLRQTRPTCWKRSATERTRAEALRRKVVDALRYPVFVLCAAAARADFFVTFVLPQFAAVLRDFNTKLDPIVAGFLRMSDFLRRHGTRSASPSSAIVPSAAGCCCAARACAPRIVRKLSRVSGWSADFELSSNRRFLPQLSDIARAAG